jgi:suppressor for copper-sensitivity B
MGKNMARNTAMSSRVVLFIQCMMFATWGCLLPSEGFAQKGKGGMSFGGGFGAMSGPQASFEATYELEKDGKRGQLHVTADIQDGWHMYSVTQAAGGPQPTEISSSSELIELTGPFAADQAPHIGEEDVWPGLPIEEHAGKLTWTAPFKLTQDITPESSTIDVAIDGQVCMSGGACVPISEKLSAKFSGYFGGKQLAESLRIEGTHAVWSASLEPSHVAPGGSATLKLSAMTDKGYHVYQYRADDAEIDFRTLIVAKKKAGLRFGAPTTTAELTQEDAGDVLVQYYADPVEWRIPITVPASAAAGEYPIEIAVGFYTCNERSCDPQAAVQITGSLTVGEADSKATPVAMLVSELPYIDVAESPLLASWIDQEQVTTKKSFSERAAGSGLELWMVLAAITGGFILNFMPCVLPVIGLKLMSFVQQSGNSHARVVSLNLSYVGGILAVMLILALLNIGAKLAGGAFGWGQQFTIIWFQVPLTLLVFAMALSFLGVWEIPIPGFATSSRSGELMQKEGLGGAFLKGVLTTVLATPCSGPFLGTLFGLTLTLSIGSIFLLYMLVGIGLGVPYLALCLSPGFIKMMPKPGAWMETLKQVLAFPLLFTVVYFVAMIEPELRIATLILLITTWFVCWLIGQVPAYAERQKFVMAWGTGLVTLALGTVIGFGFFGNNKHAVSWIPYNEAVLAKYRSEGKTVMIEFTARWCLTCQSNMKFAIDRPDVAKLIEKNDVVPLLADWSKPSDEILSKIKELDSLSIPLLAIYPADPNAEPIILRDTITESQLLDALKTAGPSSKSSESLERNAAKNSEKATLISHPM